MKTPTNVYQGIAQKLGELALENKYVNMSIEGECAGLLYVFSCITISYTRNIEYPECTFVELSDLIPVWWELHTYNADGDEVLLWDFSFTELKKYIL